MNWYLEVFRKYAVFSGRARRKEFWYFVLFNTIAVLILSIVDILIGTYDPVEGRGILGSIYTLAVMIPYIAVTVRRLHDTDRSGWWLLFPFGLILLFIVMIVVGYTPDRSKDLGVLWGALMFIVISSHIAILIFLLQDGSAGSNRFGPDPKSLPEPEFFGKSSAGSQGADAAKEEPRGEKTAVRGAVRMKALSPGARSFEISSDRELILGRSSKSDIVVDNPYVSGQHLSIKVSGRGVVLKDLGSTNGTYIEGDKLEAYIPVTLYRGERLIVGSEELVYTLE
jgi:uncharacterized membrane protein YhaH (DUF805 family)